MYAVLNRIPILFAVLTGVGMVGLPVMGLVFDAGDAVMKPLGFVTGGCFVVFFVSGFVRGYARYRREGGPKGVLRWLKTLEGAGEPDTDNWYDQRRREEDEFLDPSYADLPYNIYHNRRH